VKTVLSLAFIICASLFAREDFTGLALKIAKDELKEDGWKKFLAAAESRATQFANDNQGADRKRMLNELIEKAAQGLDGVDLKKTKEFVYWMAVCGEWGETLPDCVLEELCKREQQYAGLRIEFSWDKLQAIIKTEVEADTKAKAEAAKKKQENKK
jgi:hypothetical protein